jgi:transposase-like protein
MKSTKKTTTSKQSPNAANPTRVRTTFSKEFKLQAVDLLELGQKNPTELAMEWWPTHFFQRKADLLRHFP